MHKICCRDISKSFQRPEKATEKVLEDIRFHVMESEFLVLFGAGQCGKTTLLRIIAGLERADSGVVLVDGEEVSCPGKDRGMVFQGYSLLPWKKLLGNIELGLQLQGIPKSERRKTALEHIELVGLGGFEAYYPHQLSGGMKQRAAIARAFAVDSKIMLMDEPFNQLDAQTRVFMQKELVRIWENSGRTIIFVTNNIDEAIFLADRIVVLEGKKPGRIKKEYKVTLQRPREHTDLDFLQLREEIFSDIPFVL